MEDVDGRVKDHQQGNAGKSDDGMSGSDGLLATPRWALSKGFSFEWRKMAHCGEV